MSTPDKVSLLIDGKLHDGWTSYRIESSLLIPADSWQVSCALPSGAFPEMIKLGALVEVFIGSERVLRGRLDRMRRSVSKKEISLQLSGRDFGGVLVDCAAPIFSAREITVDDAINLIVKPLGINLVSVKTSSDQRVTIEPSERAWDAISRVCSVNGLWAWFERGGQFVVGAIDYTVPVEDRLILRFDGKGNNIISLVEQSTTERRYSEITVLSQRDAPLQVIDIDMVQGASINTRTVVRDESIGYYRPHTLIAESSSEIECRRLAHKILSDGLVGGYVITAVIAGHERDNGKLWQHGLRVHVVSEPHAIDAVFFVIAVEFSCDTRGQFTTLQLITDGAWLPDTSKQSKKAPSNKKLVIIDVE